MSVGTAVLYTYAESKGLFESNHAFVGVLQNTTPQMAGIKLFHLLFLCIMSYD